jgi:hypothetical protein
MTNEEFAFKFKALENQYNSKNKKLTKELEDVKKENSALKAQNANLENQYNIIKSAGEIKPTKKTTVPQTGYKPLSLKNFKRSVAEYEKMIITLSDEYGCQKSDQVGTLESSKGEIERLALITSNGNTVYVRFYFNSEVSRVSTIVVQTQNKVGKNTSNIIEALIELEKFLSN